MEAEVVSVFTKVPVHQTIVVIIVIIGFFFLEAGYVSDMFMVSFLTSIAFIYWGFTVAIAGYAMKPIEKAEK